MMDPRVRRVLLVLPPAFPHALLSIILTTLFGTFQCPGISLFSAPVLSAVAAGGPLGIGRRHRMARNSCYGRVRVP